jgi:hypothetical protein
MYFYYKTRLSEKKKEHFPFLFHDLSLDIQQATKSSTTGATNEASQFALYIYTHSHHSME